jgi:hypothetical protein
MIVKNAARVLIVLLTMKKSNDRIRSRYGLLDLAGIDAIHERIHG